MITMADVNGKKESDLKIFHNHQILSRLNHNKQQFSINHQHYCGLS